MNLIESIRHNALTRGERTAFHFLHEGDVDGATDDITFAALDEKARAIAAQLIVQGAAGQRALLLYPPGLDFIAGFLGCLYAGVVAVPAYPPDPARLERTLPRLRAIVNDASPRFVLTTAFIAEMAEAMFALEPELKTLQWTATDTLPLGLGKGFSPAAASPSTVAFLQYTSGSTGQPRGVKVTHGNLAHNSSVISRFNHESRDIVGVVWLPTYHDMGLIGGVVQPLVTGFPMVMMPPYAFLKRPARWLEAITHFKGTDSAFPNFALDLCVRKVTEAEKAKLDLSSWSTAWNGAEPVRQESMDAFVRAFEPCGFNPEALFPVYGLAEGTLMVSGLRPGKRAAAFRFHAESLARHRLREVSIEGDFSKVLVSCGQPVDQTAVTIVDPQTKRPCTADAVGEIWVKGPSVAAGYWNRDAETETIFQAHTVPDGVGPYLRTGDLGFVRAGELFITGRLKDVIILKGVNHYPQDIEGVAENAHAAVRTGSTAAFGISRPSGEALGLAVELRSDDHSPEELADIGHAIRQAVGDELALTIHTLALLAPGALPKTSSGKTQRRATRDALESGTLPALVTDRAPATGIHHAIRLPTGLLTEKVEAAAPAVDPLRERVIDVLAKASGYARERFEPKASLVKFLGFDSMLLMSILSELETHFGPLGEDLFSDVAVTTDDLVKKVSERASIRPSAQAPVPSETRLEDFEDVKDLKAARLMVDSLDVAAPYFQSLEGAARDTATIDGRAFINFATYNYLGLSGDARVSGAAMRAIERYGTSASASRVASGDRPVHREFETALASFLGCEAALVFASGHATNVSTVASLVDRRDLVLHDSLAHDSLLSGIKLSGARRLPFPHNDLAVLERLLREHRPSARRVLIIVEGVYSMDGDMAPVRELVALKKRYGALLMVDEAHSLGCVGETGRGMGEVTQVNRRDVDVWMGTLSKSLASCGGYIAGSRTLVDYLRYAAGGFVYAAAISPANAAAALEALRVLSAEPERVRTLQANASFFLEACLARGVDVANSRGTAIVPAIVGNSVRCLQVADALRNDGINVPPIFYPAVEEGRARLRFFVSSLHTKAQLEFAADSLAKALKAFPVKRDTGLQAPSKPRRAALLPERPVRKVFVTGASGFIGSRVVRELVNRGVAVRCLLRPTSKTHRLSGLTYETQIGDLSDTSALLAGTSGCDAVIHLACASSWSAIGALGARIDAVAVDGTRAVLDAAQKAGIKRFVHVSSVSALSGSDTPKLFDETAPYALEGRGLAYSEAKHRAEALVLERAKEGLDAVVVMPAEVYGPGDDDMVTAGNLVDILHGPVATVCEGGTSIAHVDDVAQGIVAALLRGRGGERYILGGENVTLAELASKALALAGKAPKVLEIPGAAAVKLCAALAKEGLPVPIKPDVLEYARLYWYVDSSKAQTQLGYTPRSADETLRPVVEWLAIR